MRGLLLLTAVLLAGCAGAEPAAPVAVSSGTSPPLLLVSLDGFRHDYLDLYEPPRLLKLAAEGVRADSLLPVFPTKTFPNHYTIVTGLYPSKHGIIGNSMYDPELDARFGIRDNDAVTDARWWDGEPLWITVERQGKRAATMFWPGSEAAIGGVRPAYWHAYDKSFRNGERVRQVLDWLELPDGERPDFLTLYFSDVDSAGHRSGPESDDVRRAVHRVDRHVGSLLDGLARSGWIDRLNIVVVSDHGMLATDSSRVIRLEQLLDRRSVRYSASSPLKMLWPRDGDARALARRLRGAHPRLRVYLREELPAPWNLRAHRRIGPVVLLADPGWELAWRNERIGEFGDGGAHGYPPDVPEMHGVFLARGPAFAADTRAPQVRSIDLYELMCALLQVQPAPNDGDAARVVPLLEEAGAATAGRGVEEPRPTRRRDTGE